jgi:hypothetical protein
MLGYENGKEESLLPCPLDVSVVSVGAFDPIDRDKCQSVRLYWCEFVLVLCCEIVNCCCVSLSLPV